MGGILPCQVTNLVSFSLACYLCLDFLHFFVCVLLVVTVIYSACCRSLTDIDIVEVNTVFCLLMFVCFFEF